MEGEVVLVGEPAVLVHERGIEPALIAREDRASVLLRESFTHVAVREEATVITVTAGNQGPQGIQGEQGSPGADGSGNLEVAFAWGDVSPYPLGTVTGLVVASSLVIEAAFNGTNPALTIGTMASPSLLMGAGQNDPAEAARYESNPGVRLNDPIYLFITPGLGASAGAGAVYLEIAE